MSSRPVIEARGIRHFYREGVHRRPVLNGISFDLAPDRFVAIMGPSGSGKSTLLHVLSGMDVASEGTIRILGKELRSSSDEVRTRLRRDSIGFVFQFFNLIPHLSIAENIALPLLLHNVSNPEQDPRFAETVEFFELATLLGRKPNELSGGEMQRTSIARACIHRPPLLFADEPTGNLSSAAGRRIMETLTRTRAHLGQSILLVTHNPRDAAYADEVLFLRDGSVAETLPLTDEDSRKDRIHACMERLSI